MDENSKMPVNLLATIRTCERISSAVVQPVAPSLLEALDHVERIMTPNPGSKPINAATIAAMLKGNDDE